MNVVLFKPNRKDVHVDDVRHDNGYDYVFLLHEYAHVFDFQLNESIPQCDKIITF
ncbi:MULTISPECIES: hypothetical protein [Legionellaceae]|uniref:hypothetical protein n=1 Tax=Legionellaceae TaxID=444 RepID=UPI0001527BEE|nr:MULTISPECIES: hypothetical protein [Legionellaceae]ABQ56187.1 hypothetical protein LPC_2264 [Legionella pneumophila str. Corby]ADG24360.1 hypothetical protein lpa_01548 [Legionella pneumophila 2300/99 Alcoy]MCZ4682433.1 hypothetical protein [Legionella pneumophila]MDF1931562.1 hypothetical protein [Legionella pneumophila]MDX1794085.1 hypothetical protein [Legionella pneumophila]